MATPILILNQQYVQVGLGALNFTIPSTGAYNITFEATVPNSIATGSGAGAGQGFGAGTGGGGEGFTGGDLGPSHGGVGQGFGPGNGYQQPPAAGSNQTSGPSTSSSLSVVITQQGSTIYTSTTPSPTQGNVNFKWSFLATAADAIVITLSSANASDNLLNSLKSQIQIGQGL